MRVHEQRNDLLWNSIQAEDEIDNIIYWMRHAHKFRTDPNPDGSPALHYSTRETIARLEKLQDLLSLHNILNEDEIENRKAYVLHPFCPADLHEANSRTATRCWLCDQVTLYWELLEEERVGGWTVIRL